MINHQDFEFDIRLETQASEAVFNKRTSARLIAVIRKVDGLPLLLSSLEQTILTTLLAGHSIQHIRDTYFKYSKSKNLQGFWTACDHLYDLGILEAPVAPLCATQTVSKQAILDEVCTA